MKFVVILLVLILLVLVFGPIVALVFGAGIGFLLMCWGVALLAIPALGIAAGVIGLIIWSVWWCFDRSAAEEAWKRAEEDRIYAKRNQERVRANKKAQARR